MLRKKIKGSSMFLAIVMSLLIAMMLMAFMLIFEFNSFFIAESNKTSEFIHNVNSTQLLITKQQDQFKEGYQTIDLFAEAKDSVDVLRQQWGLLDLWGVKAHSGTQSLEKYYLTGQKQSGDSLAIYLAGNNKPLALCGKTVIRGNVKLSKQGVKRAYIEGQNFIGNKLVQGQVDRSGAQLPPLISPVKTRIDQWSSCSVSLEQSLLITSLSELNKRQGKPDSILIVKSNQAFETSRVSEASWTIFHSLKSIKVSSNSRFNNCIIIAPSITVENNFEGSIQCFATDSLRVEKDAHLTFPSNVILSTQLPKRFLVIEENAKIDGAVLLDMNGDFIQKNWSRLIMEKESMIMGEVYVNGRVEIKGAIHGSLFTRLFYLKTPSSIYENHLLNVTIDRLALPKQFVNTYMPSMEKELAIIECVK